jgi:hypothetical protein
MPDSSIDDKDDSPEAAQFPKIESHDELQMMNNI